MAGQRPSKVDDHVGRRIRERRNALGITQESLAAALGVSFQQVQKYEVGTNRVAASRLWDMANILEVDVGHFFEDIQTTQRAKRKAKPRKRLTATKAKRTKPRKRRN